MHTGLLNSVLVKSRELQGTGSPAELAAGSGKERSAAKAIWVDKAEQREERGRARSLKAECSRGTGGRFGVGHVEVGACTETLR